MLYLNTLIILVLKIVVFVGMCKALIELETVILHLWMHFYFYFVVVV